MSDQTIKVEEEDTKSPLRSYGADVQKAWDLLSMHNSELQLEVQQLRKQIERMSIWALVKAKIRLTINLWLGRKEWWEI